MWEAYNPHTGGYSHNPQVSGAISQTFNPKAFTKFWKCLQNLETTMLRVLKQDLGMFPYRIQICHKLTAADMTRRLDMVNVLIRKVEDCQGFLSDLWTSDEAHFHLDGQVNSKNNIYWGTKAHIQVTQKPLHSPKVTVCAALSGKKIIGPFFFENENGITVTVNSERYIVILERFWE